MLHTYIIILYFLFFDMIIFYRSLKKKFKEKVTGFQSLRESIHQEYREVVERRVFTGN